MRSRSTRRSLRISDSVSGCDLPDAGESLNLRADALLGIFGRMRCWRGVKLCGVDFARAHRADRCTGALTAGRTDPVFVLISPSWRPPRSRVRIAAVILAPA